MDKNDLTMFDWLCH